MATPEEKLKAHLEGIIKAAFLPAGERCNGGQAYAVSLPESCLRMRRSTSFSARSAR